MPREWITDEDRMTRASRDFPSVLVADHRVHVYREGGQWRVWLNTEIGDFDGLCLGLGETRDAAVAQAIAALEAVTDYLRTAARSDRTGAAYSRRKRRRRAAEWRTIRGVPLWWYGLVFALGIAYGFWR